MDLTALLIAVSASGAAGSVFLISFIIYYGLWHDFRRLDSEPTWLTVKILLWCGVLRMKRNQDAMYTRSFGENCIACTAICYSVLGLLNFGAGVFSVILANIIRDGTCQYAVTMGSRCPPSNCSTPCGGTTFAQCGTVPCDKLRCSADISAFLLLSKDTVASDAANCYRILQGQLTVVQVQSAVLPLLRLTLSKLFSPAFCSHPHLHTYIHEIKYTRIFDATAHSSGPPPRRLQAVPSICDSL
jgi:hypothetical protein